MWIIVVTFVAFFIAALLFLTAAMARRSQESKQTQSRLESIAAFQSQDSAEEVQAVRRVESLSGVRWIDSLLRRLDIAEALQMKLQQADVRWTVGRLLLTSAVAAVAAGLLVHLRTGALVLDLVIGIAVGCVPYLYVLQQRASRFDRMRQHLPEALDLMSAAIRSGHSFSSAMGMTAKESPEPVRREFRQCFDEQNFGLDLRASLMNLVRRVPIQDIRIMVTAVLIQNETGGNLTEILDKVAYLIREDFKLQRQVRVHTAQGRLTGWILAMLPPLLGILLYLVNPQQMSILWMRPVGVKMLVGAAVMTAIGTFMIRKIVRVRV